MAPITDIMWDEFVKVFKDLFNPLWASIALQEKIFNLTYEFKNHNVIWG